MRMLQHRATLVEKLRPKSLKNCKENGHRKLFTRRPELSEIEPKCRQDGARAAKTKNKKKHRPNKTRGAAHSPPLSIEGEGGQQDAKMASEPKPK